MHFEQIEMKAQITIHIKIKVMKIKYKYFPEYMKNLMTSGSKIVKNIDCPLKVT